MKHPQKRIFPNELLLEMVAFFSFNTRWAFVRVSVNFDHFVVQKQLAWIRAELIRQQILRRIQHDFVEAVGFLERAAKRCSKVRLSQHLRGG
uniref:Uncharacterized protein n=1 Tax=Globodera rostochiensis TaxID=31243 RepID=A0A914I8D0_GLORO